MALDNEDHRPLPKTTNLPPLNRMVEEILSFRFPILVAMDVVSKMPAYQRSRTAPSVAPSVLRLQGERENLLALPETELKEQHLQMLADRRAQGAVRAEERRTKQLSKAITKEAEKFFNVASAQADFDHWTKAEYWTFDEAIALLLGKEPTVVTWAAVKRGIAYEQDQPFTLGKRPLSPGFLRTYERLRNLAERASAMKAARLKPASVIEWAQNIKAVELPEPLVRHFCSQIPKLLDLEQKPSRTNSETVPTTDLHASPAEPAPALKQIWTEKKLGELKDYRERHGTKAAAEHFGISDGRVRQLLPKEPPRSVGYSAFNHRLR